MAAWAIFCHDFDLLKIVNILSEKWPVVLDHYKSNWLRFGYMGSEDASYSAYLANSL